MWMRILVIAALVGVVGGCGPGVHDLVDRGQVRFEGDPRLDIRPPTVHVRGGVTEVSGTYQVPPRTDRSGHLCIRLISPEGELLGEKQVPFELYPGKPSFWHHGSYEVVFPLQLPAGSLVRVDACWDRRPAY